MSGIKIRFSEGTQGRIQPQDGVREGGRKEGKELPRKEKGSYKTPLKTWKSENQHET